MPGKEDRYDMNVTAREMAEILDRIAAAADAWETADHPCAANADPQHVARIVAKWIMHGRGPDECGLSLIARLWPLKHR